MVKIFFILILVKLWFNNKKFYLLNNFIKTLLYPNPYWLRRIRSTESRVYRRFLYSDYLGTTRNRLFELILASFDTTTTSIWLRLLWFRFHGPCHLAGRWGFSFQITDDRCPTPVEQPSPRLPELR